MTSKYMHMYLSTVAMNLKIIGRTHGARYRGYGYVPLRLGGWGGGRERR